MVTSTYPETGQLVQVRSRTWVVSDVRPSTLSDRPHHLVELQSVEDDAQGDAIQVIWDLEPDARTVGQSTLPDMAGFDSPERLEAFLDAVRWGSIASADVNRLQSPYRSGIKIEDYQLVPVNRALSMPRVNLLIADDVGLGKTIEAGLVMLELILRHRARTVLIVCPPSLQIQWRDQMQEKFGLEFRIVDRQLLRDLRRSRGIHANPWTHFPRLITSIDYLKRDGPMRLMRDALPHGNEPTWPRRFDLLIVDEAHNVAPSGGSLYARASDRTRAIRELTPHFEHKLFLTATPHNGYSASFSALLELLDDQRFARAVKPDRQQVDAVMIRRLKTDLAEDWAGRPRFAPRRIVPIEVSYSDDERRAHRLLSRYGDLRRKRAGDDKLSQISVEFVLKTLKKRLFSSPSAFASTLRQHIETVNAPDRKAKVTPVLKDLRARLDAADEPTETDEEAEEITLEAFSAAEDVATIDSEEREVLADLKAWADQAAGRADQKAEELLEWLEEHVNGNDERVIIFTEYRATQNWLFTLLSAADFTRNGRTMQIYGGMDRDQREEVKAAFQAHPDASPVRILLATDAASEGLDLQNYCHQIIHYEIPWNPNRLEQRNGRVDRHGQRSPEVLIYHFVGEGYDRTRRDGMRSGDLEGDLEFLARAAEKVNQIREDLGSTGQVLAAEVERAMLGETRPLRNLDELGNDDLARRTRRDLTSVRNTRTEIAEALDNLRKTRDDLDLEPERVRAAVETAIDLAGQPRLQPTEVDGYPAWFIPPMAGSWGNARGLLEHPFTRQERPIVFDHEVADALGDNVVLAHLNHPLVQRCLRLLRQTIWGADDIALHRVTARVVADRDLEHPTIIAWGRLVITGGDGERLHEQLITAGGTVQGGRFVRMERVGDVQAALAVTPLPDPVPDAILQQFQELWPDLQPRVDAALRARERQRADALERVVKQREQEEIDAITAVLTELRQTIERELTQPEILQMELFTDPDDRDQAQADRNALEHRLERIPDELEGELEAIRRRYARTEPRLFPVAVTLYIPRSIALNARG